MVTITKAKGNSPIIMESSLTHTSVNLPRAELFTILELLKNANHEVEWSREWNITLDTSNETDLALIQDLQRLALPMEPLARTRKSKDKDILPKPNKPKQILDIKALMEQALNTKL